MRGFTERRLTMAVRDIIPWGRGRELTATRGNDYNPFLALRQEMDRLFDDTFRGFGLTPFGLGDRFLETAAAWPKIDVADTGKEMKVTAELPGLGEKDVDVSLSDGMLCISGEKKEETEDKDRLISERSYGRFERRIRVDDVDEEKVSATFKNGVLTVTLPKEPGAPEKVKHIAIRAH
jgi:HSP20 family protein